MKKRFLILSILALIFSMAVVHTAPLCPVLNTVVSGNSLSPGMYAFDGNISTAVYFSIDSHYGYIEYTLDDEYCIYGITLTGAIGLSNSMTIEYEHYGRWTGFQAAVFTGRQMDDSFIDLSFDRIVANKIALRFTGVDINSSYISETIIHGSSARGKLHKILPTRIDATDNTSYFTPEQNLTDNNINTRWQTRTQLQWDSIVAKVGASLETLFEHNYYPSGSANKSEAIFTLDALYTLESIRIYFPDDVRGNLTVQLFQNSSWQDVAYIPEGEVLGWHAIVLPANSLPSDKVKFTFEGVSWVLGGIGEIELWGKGRYAGDTHISLPFLSPAGLQGHPVNTIFTINEGPVKHELEVLVNGIFSEGMDIDLNGNHYTAQPKTILNGMTIYSMEITKQSLWKGENFLRFYALSDGTTAASASLRKRISDGIQNVFSGVMRDDLLFTPGQTGDQTLTFKHTLYLKQIVVYSSNSLPLRVYARQGSDWTELLLTESDSDIAYYSGGNIQTNTLKIENPAAASLCEVQVIASPMADTPPEVRILWPEDGRSFTFCELTQTLLIGFVDNESDIVTVNGVVPERLGHYFWVTLNKLSPETREASLLTATATDNNGLSGEDSIYILTDMPSLLSIDQPDTIVYTNQPLFEISGTVNGISHVVKINDEEIAIAPKQFSEMVALEEGLNIITIQLFHKHGRLLRTLIRKAVLHSFTPELTIKSPRDGALVTGDNIIITGTFSGFGISEVLVDATPASMNGFSFVSAPVSLAEGRNIISIHASDRTGFSTEKEITVIKDSLAPELSNIYPEDGATFSGNHITATGQVEDAGTVWLFINENPVETDENGWFSQELVFTEGTQILKMYAVDTAGHVSDTVTRSVVIDTTPPSSVTVTADPVGWTNNPQPVVSFNAIDETSGIAYYKCSIDGGPFSVVTSPYTLPQQTDGEHIIVIKATDNAGWSKQKSVTVYIDTTPPEAPTELRVVPGNGKVDIYCSTLDTDVNEFIVERDPVRAGDEIHLTCLVEKQLEKDGAIIVFKTSSFEDAELLNGELYSYKVRAVDHAGNTSCYTVNDPVMIGLGKAEYTPETGAFAEYDGVFVAAKPGSLPADVKEILITEVQSNYMTEKSMYPIVSPIYSFSVNQEVDGIIQEADHALFEEKFIGSIKYDEAKIPENFPEQNLDVYYFDQMWGRWFKIDESSVDTEKNTIYFSTNHFSELSVQPTVLEDLTPQEIKDAGYNPFNSYSSYNGVNVSAQGGTVSTSITELVLPGKNNFDFVLKRTYDSATARGDAPGIGLFASIGLNITNIKAIIKAIDDGAKISEALADYTKGGLTQGFYQAAISLFQNWGDYAYSMGNGWRLNLPYIRGSNSSVLLRLPSGSFYDMMQMNYQTDNFSLGAFRNLEYKNLTGEEFIFRVTQFRFDYEVMKVVTGIKPIPGWQLLCATLIMKDGTKYDFDAIGRVTKITDPTGCNEINFHYNLMLLLDYIEDSMGRKIYFEYTNVLDNLSLPKIKRIWIDGDKKYQREIKYTIQQDNQSLEGIIPLLESAEDSGGRIAEYEYDGSLLLSAGFSVKINWLNSFLDLCTGGKYSALFNLSDVTLTGKTNLEWVHLCDSFKSPGKGRTEVNYYDKSLMYTDVSAADYFLGIIPTATEFSGDISHRLIATDIFYYESGDDLITSTHYSYHFQYGGHKQFCVDHSTENDGRQIIKHFYKSVEREYARWLDWSDWAVDVANNTLFTEAPSITIIFPIEERVEVYDAVTSILINSTEKKYTSLFQLKSAITTQGSDCLMSSEYKYDNWGNVAYNLQENTVGDYSSKVEKYYYYYFTNFPEVAEGQFSIENPFIQFELEDTTIHSLLAGMKIKNYSPLNGNLQSSNDSYVFYRYNSVGQLNRTAQYYIDINGNPVWAESSYGYGDSYGRLTNVTDPENNVTTISYNDNYDTDHYLVTAVHKNVKDADGNLSDITTKIAYEKISGWKAWEEDGRGNKTSYTYDSLGRVTGITLPDDDMDDTNNPATSIEYDDTSIWSKVTDAKGNTTTYDYDRLGRLVQIDKELDKVYDPEADTIVTLDPARTITTAVGYDGWGNITSITDPRGNTTDYEYDAMGRNTKIIYPPGENGIRPEKSMTFYYSSNMLETVDEEGRLTREYFNFDGKLLLQNIYAGVDIITTENKYDGLGNLVYKKDPKGNVTENEYDPRNLLVRTILPEEEFYENGSISQPVSPVVRFEYDKAGRKAKDILPSRSGDHEIAYTQDGLGRTIKVNQTYTDYATEVQPEKESEQKFYYDANGNKTKVTDANEHSVTFTYSTRNKVLSEVGPYGNTTTYEYDKLDNVKTMTDPRGNKGGYDGTFSINYDYDSLGRLIYALLPKAPYDAEDTLRAVKMLYDDRGNLQQQVNADGSRAEYTYSTRNKARTETVSGPDTQHSYTTQYSYDKSLLLLSTTDPGGHSTIYEYDAAGRVASVNYPEGNDERYLYDLNNNRTHVIDGKGNMTTTTYNAYNKPESVTDAKRNMSSMYYDKLGNLTYFKDNKQRIFTYDYDQLSRLVKETDPLGQIRTYGYDPQGNKTYSKDPNGTEGSYTYDARNLLTALTLTNGSDSYTSSYTYDEAGEVKGLSDINSTITYNTYSSTYTPDPYGNILKRDTTAGGKNYSVEYGYNLAGRITGVNYPQGRTVEYTYNTLGQLTGVPGYINQAPVYNNSGLLESITGLNGVVISFAYDSNNRLTDLHYNNAQEELKKYVLKYDEANNIISKNTDTRYTYDELNRLTSASLKGHHSIDVKDTPQKVGIAAEDQGGMKELEFENVPVTLTLDEASMSIGIDLGDTLGVSRIEVQPEASSHRITARSLEVYAAETNTEETYIKQTGWAYVQKDDGSIELRFVKPIYGRYIKLHCHYDERDAEDNALATGTVTNTKENLVKVYYLIDWRYETYEYDENGNRTVSTMTLEDTKTSNYTYYENSDRLMADGTWAYLYDPNGNLTAKGKAYTIDANNVIFDNQEGEYWQYEYDLLNRLVKVEKSEHGTDSVTLITTYTYDALNQRVRTDSVKNGTTRYAFTISGAVLTRETANETDDYVYVNGMLFALENTDKNTNETKTYYYITNHLGSTEMVTDADGNAVWQEELSPFGESCGEIGFLHMRAKFTGHEFDEETGLYYLVNRWYSPETGRFISVDPAKSGSNWYAYCGNNPVNYSDPYGLYQVAALLDGTYALLFDGSKNLKMGNKTIAQPNKEDSKSYSNTLGTYLGLGKQNSKNGNPVVIQMMESQSIEWNGKEYSDVNGNPTAILWLNSEQSKYLKANYLEPPKTSAKEKAAFGAKDAMIFKIAHENISDPETHYYTCVIVGLKALEAMGYDISYLAPNGSYDQHANNINKRLQKLAATNKDVKKITLAEAYKLATNTDVVIIAIRPSTLFYSEKDPSKKELHGGHFAFVSSTQGNYSTYDDMKFIGGGLAPKWMGYKEISKDVVDFDDYTPANDCTNYGGKFIWSFPNYNKLKTESSIIYPEFYLYNIKK